MCIHFTVNELWIWFMSSSVQVIDKERLDLQPKLFFMLSERIVSCVTIFLFPVVPLVYRVVFLFFVVYVGYSNRPALVSD